MPNYNLSAIEVVADGSKEFVKKMILSFISNTPEESNEMLLSIQNKDLESVKKTAHKIKPSLEMMGATDLIAINQGIELAVDQKDETEILRLVNSFITNLDQLSMQLKDDYSL